MIAYLKGTVIGVGSNYLVLLAENQSVGYKVFVTASELLSQKPGSPAELHIHTYVREDQLSLYGFGSREELGLFELLISVSGVGPKVALAVLSGVAVGHIKSAIAGGEAVVFTKVSGVGRKTAERIIIELKEKVANERLGGTNSQGSKDFSESLDALVALGYSQAEAREALKRTVSEQVASSGAMVKAALRYLGNR